MEQLSRRDLELTSLVTERLCRLLTVPTLDWCDLAAASLTKLLPKCVVAVTLQENAGSNGLVKVIAAGTAYRLNEAKRLSDLKYVPPVRSAAEPLWSTVLGGLKTKALRLQSLGLTIAEAPTDQARAELVMKRQPMNGEPASPVDLFDMFQIGEVAVGQTCIGSPDLGRGVAVLIASLDQSVPISGGVLAVMLACLPLLARRAHDAFGAEWHSPKNWLNAREESVLSHLVACRTIGEIAVEFGRSPDTIRDALKALHRKLGVNSRAQLVARATAAR